MRIAQSKGYTRLGAAVTANGNRTTYQNIVLILKIRCWTKSKNKIMSVNISRALFSLYDLLTFEDGIDRLSQNISAELPLYTV